MHTKPIIAIPPQLELDAESYEIRRRYSVFVELSGATSAVLPPLANQSELEEALSHFDGLLLTGGADIQSCLYGESPVEGCDEPQPDRDAMELAMLKAAQSLQMPVLGICRGTQIINVAYGGTLHQKVSDGVTPIEHWQPEPYDVSSHDVHIECGTMLMDIFGANTISVNSMHHQAIHEAGTGLRIAARDDAGLIESVYDPSADFLLGVQWHPEYAPKLKESLQVGRAFVDACKKYRERQRRGSDTANGVYAAEYLTYAEVLDPHGVDRKRTWDYLESSTSKYDGITVYSSYLPKFFDQATFDTMKYISETTYGILCKVLAAYIKDPSYRTIFDYDPRFEELILLPSGYDEPLPMMRIDIFLDEDTLDARFCEFNSDGSSGMNENREITLGVKPGASYQRFADRHKITDCIESLFDGWVDKFLETYSTFDRKVENPTIAIVDFLEHAVTEEFKVFAKIFENRGYDFAVYDMRELELRDGHLYGKKAFYGNDDQEINAIWRRCISSDVVDHWDISQPLIEAVRQGYVALIGSFAGHIVHDKRIFCILQDPRTKQLLSSEENAFLERTIPFTAPLDSKHVSLNSVKAERTRWVIKPLDSYGSQGVHVGLDYNDAEWDTLIDRYANCEHSHGYLVQEFCPPYPSPAVPLYGKESDYSDPPKVYKNLSGLFVYCGTFSGVFSRQGPQNIILGKKGGVTAPSLWVDVEMEPKKATCDE